MDYFTILNLDREPFSNSPDPEFFFQSRQHVDCLQKLELALRLKRGLNIVIGAVGAGKTTLCRTLLKRFSADTSIESHLILDPSYNSPLTFLESICSMIVGEEDAGCDALQYKERIKHHLYQKGVDEEKTVILIIDEGQKFPVFCLEILRELLNYETNDHKLLQIVLFAQEEFQEVLDSHANLADRVNLIHFLGPMSFSDTREMINFRVKHASSQARPPKLFTTPAMHAIFRATGGYPRKIINLCHQCMLALIVQNRSRVGWRLVRSCKDRSLAQNTKFHRHSWTFVFSMLMVFAAIGVIYLIAPGLRPSIFFSTDDNRLSAMQEEEQPVTEPAASISAYEPPDESIRSVTTPLPAVSTPSVDEMRAAADKRLPSPVPLEAVTDTPEKPHLEMEPEITVSDAQGATADESLLAPPLLLGELTVKKNDTLGMMVKLIYGVFSTSYLKAVLDANLHIGHADAIRVGDTIVFPAIAVSFKQRSYPLWWLSVGEVESLEKAFRSVKASGKKDAPLMRMISMWNNKTGLKYVLFVSGYFLNPAAAKTMMAKLPAEFSRAAEIVSGWPSETILFADPFLGKGY